MGLRGPLRCGLVFVFYLASRPRTPPRLDVEQRAWYVIINTHGVTPWLGPYPGGAASSQASIILECVSAIQLPGPWRPRPQYKPNLAPGLWSRWGPKDTTSRRPPQRTPPRIRTVVLGAGTAAGHGGDQQSNGAPAGEIDASWHRSAFGLGLLLGLRGLHILPQNPIDEVRQRPVFGGGDLLQRRFNIRL